MSFLGLGGCASGIVDPVPGSPTVADSYSAAMHGQTTFDRNQQMRDIAQENLKNQKTLVLPKLSQRENENVRVESALNAQFPELPNPKSIMYVFGHYAGNGEIPVAGHFVPFSFYTRNYYAMPNEVLRPYNDGQFNSMQGNA